MPLSIALLLHALSKLLLIATLYLCMTEIGDNDDQGQHENSVKYFLLCIIELLLLSTEQYQQLLAGDSQGSRRGNHESH